MQQNFHLDTLNVSWKDEGSSDSSPAELSTTLLPGRGAGKRGVYGPVGIPSGHQGVPRIPFLILWVTKDILNKIKRLRSLVPPQNPLNLTVLLLEIWEALIIRFWDRGINRILLRCNLVFNFTGLPFPHNAPDFVKTNRGEERL